MRIGINLLWLVAGDVGGSEDYAIGLTRALARTGAAELVVLCQAPLLESYPDLPEIATVLVAPSLGDRRSLRLLWESSWLPYQVRRLGLDVVHHLGGTVPPVASGSRTVLTIYDLQPLFHPERFPPAKRRWLRTMLPRSARQADAVCTISNHVRHQVIENLGSPPERTLVASPGLGDGHHGAGTTATSRANAAITAVRQMYGLTGDLLLYPAIAYPHKNHDVVIRALPRLLTQHPGTTLVCTGRPGPQDDHLVSLGRQLGVPTAVRRLGRIPRHHLEALFSAAAALVFPSTYEGFGLPLLEAMGHGLPIVASRASAIPEVVAGNGVLVDAHDPAAWTDTLDHLLGDPAYRARLADGAQRGAHRYTWEATATSTVDLYRDIVSTRPGCLFRSGSKGTGRTAAGNGE